MSVTEAIAKLRDAEGQRATALAELGGILRAARAEMGRDEYAALLGQVRTDAHLTGDELAGAVGVSRARLYQLLGH